MNDLSWTEPRKAELTRLWDAGYTARKIAELMGMPGGRNAIIGKARRLNLKARRSLSHSRAEYKQIREARKALGPVRKAARRPPTQRAPVVSVPLDELPSRNILFAKRLTGLECSWIAGEPTASATCCGRLVQLGSQFCSYHHHRCFRPPESRAR